MNWRKASASNQEGCCVEIGTGSDVVLIRDSKHPNGGNLMFCSGEFAALVNGIKSGEWDDLVN